MRSVRPRAKARRAVAVSIRAVHAPEDRGPVVLVAEDDEDIRGLVRYRLERSGYTVVTAIATPGHAPAHHAYAVADRPRGTEEPWLVFTGDSLLIGDVGRPDLHVTGDEGGQARLLHESLRRLLELPDHVVVYPSHFGGSVCGRALSGNPVSSVGFERSHNEMLAIDDAGAFASALLADAPPRPADQDEIVAANRSGQVATRA